jgi:putative Mg2+ transporter-C (MgtC) family protein
MLPWQILVGRLLIATVCGAILGVQAEVEDRPGGLRTHILTTLGAAIFCGTAAVTGEAHGEAMRVVQGIASGVGFIGAATVLRGIDSVHGVTNAAMLWIAAAIGCEAALGSRPLLALGLAVFVALVNGGVFQIVRWVTRKTRPPEPSPVDDRGAPGETRAERNTRDLHSAL